MDFMPITESNVFKAYIKGLPWACKDHELTDFFKDVGPTVSVELPLTSNGRASGTAYVTFATRAELDAALAMDGTYFPGTERWLKILEGFDRPPMGSFRAGGGGADLSKSKDCDSIFVGNLPYDVTEDQMFEHFSGCGEVAAVRLAMNSSDGSFKGFGHVQFYDGAHCDAAVKLAGTEIGGRAIRCDYAPRGGRDSGRGGRGEKRGRDGGSGFLKFGGR